MGKGGKLGKLIRKWQAVSRLTGGRTNSSTIAACDNSGVWNMSMESTEDKVPAGDLQAVYVGKSRRRYLISSHLVDQPLFRDLLDRSSGEGQGMINVGCEVVLFDHLLWMLENADPQPDSLDELLQFYAC